MKVHGTSAVLLGLHVLLFSQKVGESKKVRIFFISIWAVHHVGSEIPNSKSLTNQKSPNQEILEKYQVVKVEKM